MNILDRNFRYIPASAHSDPTPFRERMRERMKAAQAKQPQQPVQLTKREMDQWKPASTQ